jgi:putative acetyltransferase
VPHDEATIRLATSGDAESVIRVRRLAILAKAVSHYSPEQVAAWADEENPAHRIERRIRELAEGSLISFVAEIQGTIIGFADIIPSNNAFGAIYVAPGNWHGVGEQLLKNLETEARRLNFPHITADSSLNAERFYRKHGYQIIEHTTYPLRNGISMPSIKVIKYL